jgi:hypothetical protein
MVLTIIKHTHKKLQHKFKLNGAQTRLHFTAQMQSLFKQETDNELLLQSLNDESIVNIFSHYGPDTSQSKNRLHDFLFSLLDNEFNFISKVTMVSSTGMSLAWLETKNFKYVDSLLKDKKITIWLPMW